MDRHCGEPSTVPAPVPEFSWTLGELIVALSRIRPALTSRPPPVEALEPRRLLAAAELAVDVDPRTHDGGNLPVLAGGVGYLQGPDNLLWRTDGTGAGTAPFPIDGVIGAFPRAAVGDTLYFEA